MATLEVGTIEHRFGEYAGRSVSDDNKMQLIRYAQTNAFRPARRVVELGP